jgi:hypothetical protein
MQLTAHIRNDAAAGPNVVPAGKRIMFIRGTYRRT